MPSKSRFSASRRNFLRQASTAGLLASSNVFFGRYLSAQAATPAGAATQVYVDTRRTVAPLDRNVFGSFLEHLGRAIYEGIYDPSSKFADSNGFRKDVMDEIRTMGVPIIRYPGGNFVSGYNWLDGVGSKKDRPRVLDKAWNTMNSNQFGTNEFMAWCKAVGTDPLMGLNLGTGTPEDAAALVEYCNVDKGTKWSDLRRQHGYAEPYSVKRWCLGNEMDGPWQIGHLSGTEYGVKAADAARQMRAVDPSLQFIVCGSSGHGMPTYLEYDRQVLEQCYEYAHAISLHRYFDNTSDTGGDSSKFLALNLSMETQIEEVAAVCDLVRGIKRSPRKFWLSFDEWNVWYRARTPAAYERAPHRGPHLLEEVYNLEDALLVGGIVEFAAAHSDSGRTGLPGAAGQRDRSDHDQRQRHVSAAIYYPYTWALQYAKGNVLDVLVESPTYESSGMGAVPYLDVAGTIGKEDGETSLSCSIRDLAKSHDVEIVWEDKAPGAVAVSMLLTGDDLKPATV